MPLPLDEFVKGLEESGAMSPPEVSRFQLSLPHDSWPSGDAAPFASQLVRKKLLTPYQATTIYQGKGRSLNFRMYVILDLLCRTNLRLLFKAHQREMRRTVVLAMMSPEATRSPSAVEEFHREIEIMARLTHPNIVAALNADEVRGIHFAVMEFVDRPSLAKLVTNDGALPVSTAVGYTAQAANGLEYAHAQGLIHGTINPHNLLLSKGGVVKILGLGAPCMELTDSTDREGDSSSARVGIGAVDCLSPEQVADDTYSDTRSGIYSLGATFFYLLTGRSLRVWQESAQTILSCDRPIRLLSTLRPDVPAVLETVFQKMVAKRPEDRYQTMTELKWHLEALITAPR